MADVDAAAMAQDEPAVLNAEPAQPDPATAAAVVHDDASVLNNADAAVDAAADAADAVVVVRQRDPTPPPPLVLVPASEDTALPIVIDNVPDPRSSELRDAAAPPLPSYSLTIGQGDRLAAAFSRMDQGTIRVKRVVEAKRPRAAVSPFLVNDDTFLSTYGNALLLANKPGKGGRALAGRRTYHDESNSEGEGSHDDDDSDGPPKPRPAPAKGKRVRIARTKHHMPSKDDMQLTAAAPEALVPIRLELDIGNYRLRDSFLWNLNEPLMRPHQYAQLLCDDLDLPHQLFEGPITSAIETQLAAHNILDTLPTNPAGVEGPIVIDIDLLVGNVRLTDRFEWDPHDTTMTPEEFARILAADLGVGGEFVPEIAHAIHEQVGAYRRRLFNFLEGDDSALDGVLSRGLERSYRDLNEAADWAPQLAVLNENELERYLEGRERTHRAKRRARDDPLMAGLLTRGSRRTRRGYVEEPTVDDSQALARFASQNRRSMYAFAPAGDAETDNGAARSDAMRAMMHAMGYQGGDGAGSAGGRVYRDRTSRFTEKDPTWRCTHCGIGARDTPSFRRGPLGPNTLCNACGLSFSTRRVLPLARLNLYKDMSSQRDTAASSAAAD